MGELCLYIVGEDVPIRCTFCLNLLDNRWRPLNAENILNEVKILTEKYKLEYINFNDDNFFLNKKRVEDFSKALISEKIDIKWQGCCRANYFNSYHVNDDLMKLVKKVDALLWLLVLNLVLRE